MAFSSAASAGYSGVVNREQGDERIKQAYDELKLRRDQLKMEKERQQLTRMLEEQKLKQSQMELESLDRYRQGSLQQSQQELQSLDQYRRGTTEIAASGQAWERDPNNPANMVKIDEHREYLREVRGKQLREKAYEKLGFSPEQMVMAEARYETAPMVAKVALQRLSADPSDVRPLGDFFKHITGLKGTYAATVPRNNGRLGVDIVTVDPATGRPYVMKSYNTVQEAGADVMRLSVDPFRLTSAVGDNATKLFSGAKLGVPETSGTTRRSAVGAIDPATGASQIDTSGLKRISEMVAPMFEKAGMMADSGGYTRALQAAVDEAQAGGSDAEILGAAIKAATGKEPTQQQVARALSDVEPAPEPPEDLRESTLSRFGLAGTRRRAEIGGDAGVAYSTKGNEPQGMDLVNLMEQRNKQGKNFVGRRAVRPDKIGQMDEDMHKLQLGVLKDRMQKSGDASERRELSRLHAKLKRGEALSSEEAIFMRQVMMATGGKWKLPN